MRKILAYKITRIILRFIFSLFYKKKYLIGKYYDKKYMGWLWAFRSLKGRVFGENRKVPWPVHPRTIVNGANNIIFDDTSLNVFQVPGCYWQAHSAGITIGKECYVAPNVGIITTNHDVKDPSKHTTGKSIIIKDYCWIGMNAIILPGVILGPHTVVAAGAVVTKSFEGGNCIIGGVPAKVIKNINYNLE